MPNPPQCDIRGFTAFNSAHAARGWISFLHATLQLPKEQPYCAIDLFAGCGGLSLGFECAGVKTIGYEMKPECCETYRANLRSECRNEMLTPATECPPADIVLGGPPCQPFSRRGKRKGKEDARDGFPAYVMSRQSRSFGRKSGSARTSRAFPNLTRTISGQSSSSSGRWTMKWTSGSFACQTTTCRRSVNGL